jgi:alpha-methylacyl-CoA racemase
MLAFGMVCGILEARESGQGQVVDAAMVDGAATLMAMFFSRVDLRFTDQRGTHMLDGGAHFYGTYETLDGGYICIGSIEPPFYALLLEKTGVDPELFSDQMDDQRWPALKAELARVFLTRTRDEWCEILEGTDVCFAPVLSIEEAPTHPHNHERGTFLEVDGLMQPAPAPRFSRSVAEPPRPAPARGQHTAEVLSDFGCTGAEIDELVRMGVVRTSTLP